MDAKVLFEILMREQTDMLLVYLRSVVRDPAAVDDLYQETMIVAWRNLERFDRARPFGPWLRGIAGKLVLAYRRKSAAAMFVCDQKVLEVIDAQLGVIANQTGDTLDEKVALLRACVASLPEHYRSVIHERYQQDDAIPTQSLAEKLSLTLETFKKRLQRARAMLLECMERKLPSVETA